MWKLSEAALFTKWEAPDVQWRKNVLNQTVLNITAKKNTKRTIQVLFLGRGAPGQDLNKRLQIFSHFISMITQPARPGVPHS